MNLPHAKISIVIPVYNGAHTIGELVDKLTAALASRRLEIVLVNDASPDNSHEVCRALADTHPSIVTYVQLAKNFGEHNAVMAGLSYSTGDYVVIMDDDFQNPPQEVSLLVDEAEEHHRDVVYTYYAKKQHHWLRNLGSAFNGWVANFMLDKPRDLYLSSFKCVSRFAVNEILKYTGPFPYIDGLLLRATRNIGTVMVSHEKRRDGASGYTLRKLVGLWLAMFVNFSVMPLRASTFLGFGMSCVGAIMTVDVVVERLRNPHLPLGWPFLAVMVLTFSGVQLLILGLIGEYLGRLFLSTNMTPQFVVREVKKNVHVQ